METKYIKITRHLNGRGDDRWVATFAEIEEILGFSLPLSARKHQAWWANQDKAQSRAWEEAGWKTTDLDLGAQQVTFVRAIGNAELDDIQAERSFSIEEAKEGLARHFKVNPSQIEISIKW